MQPTHAAGPPCRPFAARLCSVVNVKPHHIPEMTITRVDSRGRGRGRWNDRDVALFGVLAGERVAAQTRGTRRSVVQAEVTRILSSAVPRRTPRCTHFGECGGCTLQQLPYRAQLELKRAMVEAAFADVAPPSPVRWPPIAAVVPAVAEFEYRNKLEFSFGAQRWLTAAELASDRQIADRRGFGFHAPGRFDRVLDLSECHLGSAVSEAIRAWVRDYTSARGLTFYDARRHDGFLRQLMVRTNRSGEALVLLVTTSGNSAARDRLLDALAAAHPSIVSLWWAENDAVSDSLYAVRPVRYRGAESIVERCGELELELGPTSFYQTNPAQAETLYTLAIDALQPRPDHTVLDLYCGIGSITLSLARRVARVIGVETVPEAVTAARANAVRAGIDNAEFLVGAVEGRLPELAARYGVPDRVVVDPPRAGLHPKARRALLDLAAARIVYVSCNPRSQAVDLIELAQRYRVVQLQPVDMFPQTRHVECIAVLERNDTP